ncbi:hypothetical protein [Nitratireductor luteus]|nr:hypothetical protein [Nitratireductor luteus]
MPLAEKVHWLEPVATKRRLWPYLFSDSPTENEFTLTSELLSGRDAFI